MMFFKKRDNTGADEIKRAVEEAPAKESEPTIHDFEVEDLPPDLPGGVRYDAPDTAPLFVKLDRYKDLLDRIQEMKAFNAGLKQTFAVVHEAEAVRMDALKIMRATVQRMDKTLAEIDTSMVRPRGIDLDKAYPDTETRYIESSLTELQRQLATLRRDLQELKE